MYYTYSKIGNQSAAVFCCLRNISYIKYLQIAMGFIGNYAPGGLSPQNHDMPVIANKESASGGRQALKDR